MGENKPHGQSGSDSFENKSGMNERSRSQDRKSEGENSKQEFADQSRDDKARAESNDAADRERRPFAKRDLNEDETY